MEITSRAKETLLEIMEEKQASGVRFYFAGMG